MGLMSGKSVVIFGIANKRSIAWGIAQALHREGARLALNYQNERMEESVRKLAGDVPVFACDVGVQEQIERLRDDVAAARPELHGIVHSIAFADYSGGPQPFERTSREGFLRAVDVSCFSLVAIANAFRDRIDPAVLASWFTISGGRNDPVPGE